MRNILLSVLLTFSVLLAGCGTTVPPATTAAPEMTTVPATEEILLPEPNLSSPEPALPSLAIPGIDVEDVIAYFNEVCLDAEFVHSGDPSRLQKWDIPIYYSLHGSPTEEDLAVLTGFTDWLNTLEGFPGIQESDGSWEGNLQIHFCSRKEMIGLMGETFSGMDGAVTFWYDDDAIYDATICIRTDLDQHLRNSVILEELYNGLGPIQDTWLREDSIIYAGFSEPQQLTEVDELLLRLLYRPELQCGMNARECEILIRELYH